MRILRLVSASALGYLLGTVPSADIASRLVTGGRIDLRSSGSRNPGGVNARRVLGHTAGRAVIVADVAKGFAACACGRTAAGDVGAHVAGVAAVLGHCYPLWNGFRGGKGVATSLGQCLYTLPAYAPVDYILASTVARPAGPPPSRARLGRRVVECVASGQRPVVEARAPESLGTAPRRCASPRQRRDNAGHRVERSTDAATRRSRRARATSVRIAICTDSSSLLSAAAAESLGVDVVPVAVALDGEPFDDRAEPIDDFYAQLREGAVVTTSQPSPAAFAAAYARAASRGAETVLSIHLDARVSGTISSAEIAAREASLAVIVVDTGTVSFGVAVCVREAARVVADGGSAGNAVAAATRLAEGMRNVFVARNGPGGRVPSAHGWTVLAYADGRASAISSCATVAETVNTMARSVLAEERTVAVAVGHAGSDMEAPADELAHRLARSPNAAAVERYRVTAAIGAHTGAESFGAFWWPTP